MKALRWHGRGDIRLDEIAPPGNPKEFEIQIKVLFCGICGTDIEEWRSGPHLINKSPIILGHEISGQVVQVGRKVNGFEVGDRVGVDGLSGCGACEFCLQNKVNLCSELSAVGLMSDGGLTEFLNLDSNLCIKIPDSAPAETGALAETLSVGIRALKRARFLSGESVTIIGAGAVGLLAAQAAAALGACQVIIYEMNEIKRSTARKLGFEHTYHPDQFTNNSIFTDISIDCSGSRDGVDLSINSVRPAGRVVLLAISTNNPELNTLEIVSKEKEIIGSLSHIKNTDYSEAIDMIASRKVDIENIISEKIPLDLAIENGFEKMISGSHSFIKILITPNMN